MGFWKTVLAVFVGILLYDVVDNLVQMLGITSQTFGR